LRFSVLVDLFQLMMLEDGISDESILDEFGSGFEIAGVFLNKLEDFMRVLKNTKRLVWFILVEICLYSAHTKSPFVPTDIYALLLQID